MIKGVRNKKTILSIPFEDVHDIRIFMNHTLGLPCYVLESSIQEQHYSRFTFTDNFGDEITYAFFHIEL